MRMKHIFSRTLGVHSLRNHFNRLQRELEKNLSEAAESIGDNPVIKEVLDSDQIFESLIVQL